jgi:hypothetical protein
MRTNFQTVFDLTLQTDLIHPAYWFIGIFVAAGILLVVLAWLAVRKRWRWRRSLPSFAALWIIVCTYIIVTDVRDTAALRSAVERGEIQTVEGCLDYFRPGTPSGTKTTAGHEEWSVNGLVFSYGAGEPRPAFHLVSTAGGAVRADSRVRVGFVVSPEYGRREIIKLELASRACPAARLVEPLAQP